MKRILPALLLVSILSWGQSSQPSVYLDPNNPFSPDFTAALQKKNVPVVVTTDPAQAKYLATITLADNQGSIFQGITSAITTGIERNMTTTPAGRSGFCVGMSAASTATKLLARANTGSACSPRPGHTPHPNPGPAPSSPCS